MEPILNKKASHKYILTDRFEAGIVLEGWEIKPILNRAINIENAHVIIKNGELYLLNSLISAPNLVSNNITQQNSARTRKLLLKKQEIMRLIGKIEKAGYTLVPTKIYTKSNKIKIEISLAKGKKSHDKREDEKTAQVNKNLQSIFKHSAKKKT